MTKHTEPGAQFTAKADGFYLWRPPDYATASVTAQSRWGNLYGTSEGSLARGGRLPPGAGHYGHCRPDARPGR
jgi:hypothetical protein